MCNVTIEKTVHFFSYFILIILIFIGSEPAGKVKDEIPL